MEEASDMLLIQSRLTSDTKEWSGLVVWPRTPENICTNLNHWKSNHQLKTLVSLV